MHTNTYAAYSDSPKYGTETLDTNVNLHDLIKNNWDAILKGRLKVDWWDSEGVNSPVDLRVSIIDYVLLNGIMFSQEDREEIIDSVYDCVKKSIND